MFHAEIMPQVLEIDNAGSYDTKNVLKIVELNNHESIQAFLSAFVSSWQNWFRLVSSFAGELKIIDNA
jgi:hypothetical protein